MQLTREEVAALARKRQCPRCDFDKTFGNALCRTCRSKLPPHMRLAIENIPAKDSGAVGNALRAAANYFTVHFASIRKFGGGRKR
jgi:hypothetical protein